MIEVLNNIANMRYLMNEALTQMDAVHNKMSQEQIDLETVQLNIKDIQDQMTTIASELQEAYDGIGEELK